MSLQTEDYYKSLYDEANLMVAILATDKTLITANKMLLDFAKVTLQDIHGRAYWELPWWQHSPELQNMLVFTIEKAFLGETTRFEATHKDYNGDLHELDFIIKPIIKDGEVQHLLAMGYNITDLVNTRKALTRREKQIKAFFDYSDEGYFFFMLLSPVSIDSVNKKIIQAIVMNQRITSFNNKLSNIIGEDYITHSNILNLLGIGDEDIFHYWMEMLENGHVNLETEIYNKKTSKILYLHTTLVAIYSDTGQFEGNFAIVRDITKETLYLRELSFLANKDSLTGLNNRRYFYIEAQQLFHDIKVNNRYAAVAMVDIDHFKAVNDKYGHDVGDNVIKWIAHIIDSYLDSSCICGRYGGEEFVIILPTYEKAALEKMETLRKTIENTKIPHDKGTLNVTVSIGLSLIDSSCKNIDTAISQADKALYESKNGGRNRVTLFIDSLHGENYEPSRVY